LTLYFNCLCLKTLFKFNLKNMKKSISSFVLFIFILGIFSPTIEIYAAEKNSLDTAIDNGINLVEKLWDIADTKLEAAEKKEKDSEQKERIVEKQQEIEAYIEQVQETLEDDVGSQKELKEVLEEAKKVIVLKVVSGVTEYENIEDMLPKEVAQSKASRESATEVLQDSFTNGERISLIVSSSFSLEKMLGLFRPFDESIKAEFLYQIDGENVFEVFITKTSIFAQEMLQDLQEGNVPESLLWIQLVKPEVFTIGEEMKETKIEITWEDLTQTWWVSRYNPSTYLKTEMPRVAVAIIDTGVDSGHPDLSSNVKPGYDFVNDDIDPSDDQWHGTHVAGTIGALNNGSGIVGVNPYVDIVPLKICNEKWFCPNYAILRALDYVKDKKIKVVNMSLWGRGDPSTNAICQSIEALTREGTLVVSAAGNSNVDTSTFVPGGCSDAITVGAVDETLTRASFSNYGQKVDVSAPGVGIYSTSLLRGYKKLSGTSMAAPHITGLVSLLKSKYPSIGSAEVKQLFKDQWISVTTGAGKYMAGFVHPKNVLEAFQGQKVAEKTDVKQAEQVQEIVQQTNQTEKVKEWTSESDGVRIDTNVPDTSSYESKKREAEERNKKLLLESETFSQTNIQSIGDKILDFLNLGEKTVINSGEDIEKIDSKVLPQKLEPVRPTVLQWDQYFWPDGKPLDTQSIQNLEEEEWKPGSPDDFVSLNDSIPNTKWQIASEDETETPKKVELFVDGATPEDARVQSDEQEVWKEVPFSLYTPSPHTLLDSEGKPVDTSSLQKITPTIENLDYNYDYPKEVFVDGVEKGTEINSVDEAKVFEPVEVKEVNWYEEQLKKQEIEKEGSFVEPVQESTLSYTKNVQNIELSSEDVSEGSSILSADEVQYYPWMYLPSLDPLALADSIDISSLEPSEYLLSDGVDIATSSTPLPTTTIRHVFSDLRNTSVYDWFVRNRANYSLKDTSRVTLGADFIQTNISDKWASLFTTDRYNYGTSVSPKRFYGKFKTIVSSTNFWRNQSSWMGIYASDNTPLIDFSVYTLQAHAVSYDKSGWRDHICRANTSFDEMKCLNHQFEPGKFIFIIYRKSNGKYTRVAYKLPESLFWEYRVEFDVNFAKKTFVTQFFDTNNILVTTVQWDFSSLVDFTNINLSDFKYYASAGTTNNSTQKNTPIEIGVDFTENTSSPVLTLPTTPKNFTWALTGSGKVTYSWLDSEREQKYILKDEKNTVIVDSINANTVTLDENNLEAGKSIQRKLCAFSTDGEVCSDLISLKIPTRYTCTVEEEKSCQFTLPNASTFTYTFTNTSVASQSFPDVNSFALLWKLAGTSELQISKNGIIEAIVGMTVTAKPPLVIDVEFLKIQWKWLDMPNASTFTYTFSQIGVINMWTYHNGIWFNANQGKEWNVEIYVKQAGIHKYTLRVKSLPIPEPKQYNATVEEGAAISVFLPWINHYYYGYRSSWNAQAWIYQRNIQNGVLELSINWRIEGNIIYFIYDEYSIHRYTINLKVLPSPPIVKEYSVFEWRWVSTDVWYARNQVFSASVNGITSVWSDWWRKIWFQWIKPGYTELFMKDINSAKNYLFKITVVPKPVPKIYELTMQPADYANLTLPEAIGTYQIQVDNPYLFSSYTIVSPNTFQFVTNNNGTSNIYLKDKNGFDIYIIKVTVKPREEYVTINLTDSFPLNYSSSYSIGTSDWNTVYVQSNNTIYGRNLWKATLTATRKWVLRAIIYVTVTTPPPPQEFSYDVIVNDRQTYSFPGYLISWIETSNYGMYELYTLNNAFRLKPLKSGIIKVYIRSYYGQYVSNIIKIRASSLPPVVLECSVPLGYNCISYDYMDTNQGYSFGVTNSKLQEVVLERFTAGSRTYYRYILRSKQEWTWEVYIYKNEEHVATIKTTVSPPVSPLSLQWQLKTIKEGEQLTLKVQWWAAPYKRGNYDSTALNYRLDETTWDIQITAKQKPGNHTVEIKDKYDQTITFGVTVLDAFLTVSQNQVTLQAGDNTTVSIDDYYVALEPITKTNDNITLQLVDEANPNQPNKPKKYLQIFAKQSGTTSITLKDAEGTIVVVNVTVTGGTKPIEEEELEKELTSFQSLVTRFDTTRINDEAYLDLYLKEYDNYFEIEDVAVSNVSVQSFDYINDIIESFSESRYEDKWDSFARNLIKIVALKKPEIQKYEEILLKHIKTNYKSTTQLKYSLKHPDENLTQIEHFEGKYTSKINGLINLNRKLYLVDRQNLINLMIAYRDAYVATLQKSIKEYWETHPEELEQRQKESIQEIVDGLWLKNAWEAWWAIAAAAKAEIESDPYLEEEAKKALYQELEDLTKEYTSIEWLVLRKWKFAKKLLGFGKKTKNILNLRFKSIKSFNDSSNHFSKHWTELWYTTARDYEKAAIDFMKNREWNDFITWKRTYDKYWNKTDDVFKVNVKTGMLWIADKYGNITTFHKSNDFLKNPTEYLKNNKN
jgi:hypothetical protein